jgi:hypothetical protein
MMAEVTAVAPKSSDDVLGFRVVVTGGSERDECFAAIFEGCPKRLSSPGWFH